MEVIILKWFLIINIALSLLMNIALIGNERSPYTVGGAIASLIVNVPLGLWIWHALS